MMFCMKMATLLLLFATVGGRPMKISMGRVRKDPPPAIQKSRYGAYQKQ